MQAGGIEAGALSFHHSSNPFKSAAIAMAVKKAHGLEIPLKSRLKDFAANCR